MSAPSEASRQVPIVARRCLVNGRVQGVYYRASARRRALAVGITGHARNLPDGRVEVIVWGPAALVQDFIDWLWVGPSTAKVSAVQVEPLDASGASCPIDFTTG